MKNKILQYLTLLLLFFTTQAYSNPINKINFIGLNNSSESTLLELIPFKIGQDFSSYSSDKIIESLFKSGLFENISILKNENSIEITLKENPNIKYFDINLNFDTGISSWLKGEKSHLTSEMTDVLLEDSKLTTGNIFTKKKLDEFIVLLESKYFKSGFYNVEIKQNIELDAQNRVGIELNIIQGERATIDSFKISGSKNISEKELLKLFKIGEADMSVLNYFTNKDEYSEAELTRGIDLMTNTYFDSGYLDFKILNIESNLDKKQEKISINIEISEGIQYKLGKISFEGELGNISLSELNASITMN